MLTKQWLTESEREAWVALTGLLIKLPTALDAAMAKEAGLTYFEYLVLARLAEEGDGMLRMSLLAERTNGSLSRLSHVVRRLEKQDLVRREGAREDRRATNAILTGAGRHLVEQAAPAHARYVRDVIIASVSADDLTALARVGQGILDRLETAG